MNTLRATLALVYATCAYVAAGAAGAIWRTSQASRVDWLYLMVAALILILAVGATAGLLLKRKWGSVWAITLCAVIVLSNVGVALTYISMTGAGVENALGFRELGLSGVAIATIALLLTPAFRRQYAANMTPNQTRANDARAG
jgi:hypothetical protein